MSISLSQSITHHVPFIPTSVSVPLVNAAPLAAKLAATAPSLRSASKAAFVATRVQELARVDNEEIQTQAVKAILDLNMQEHECTKSENNIHF